MRDGAPAGRPSKFWNLSDWDLSGWDLSGWDLSGWNLIVVALDRGRATVVGECKWSNALVDERVFVDLQHKAQRFPLAERPLCVLASRSGFDAVLRQRAQHGDLILLTPDDLFA